MASPRTGHGVPPQPPCGEACHPSTRTERIEAPPPSLLWRAVARAQFVRSFSSNWSADKPQCRGQHETSTTTAQLVLPSVSDPIINVSALDHSRCNQQRLGTRSVIMWNQHRRPLGGVGMDRVRTKHAVPPRRGPVSTTRHEKRRSTRRNDDSARPDSDTTVQYASATGTRPLP